MREKVCGRSYDTTRHDVILNVFFLVQRKKAEKESTNLDRYEPCE